MRELDRPVIRAALAAGAVAFWVAMWVVALGCGGDDGVGARCEKATRHISLGVIPPDAPGQPGAEERAVIEVVIAATVAECKREGLSQAQADCIFALSGTGAASWRKLAECPAIAARRPSWLKIPSPEMLDLMEQAERRQRERDAEDESAAEGESAPEDESATEGESATATE